jgi:hypothetical protein
VRRVWHAWGKCWNLLHRPMEYPDEPAPNQHKVVWKARAEMVKVEMDNFVALHVVACGVTEGLYLHILHAHAHTQIKRWGDLRVRQTQGLEHAHKIRKQIGLNATNRIKGQRLETMLAFKQVLQALIRWQSKDFVRNRHEKNKAALIRRTHAKILRENSLMPKGWISPALTPLHYRVQSLIGKPC